MNVYFYCMQKQLSTIYIYNQYLQIQIYFLGFQLFNLIWFCYGKVRIEKDRLILVFKQYSRLFKLAQFHWKGFIGFGNKKQKSLKFQENVILTFIIPVYPYNKETRCVFVCLYQRILLTAEPIGLSFTGQLLIGPGKDLKLFWGYHHPPKRNHKKSKFFYVQRLLRNIARYRRNLNGTQISSVLFFVKKTLKVLLEASRGVAASYKYITI